MLSPFLRDAVGPVCRSRRANDLVVMATAVWPSGLRAVWRAKGPTNPGVSLNEPTYDIQIGSTRISMPDRCGPIGGLGDWLKHKATTSLVGLLRPTKPEGNFPLPEHHVGLPLGTRRSYHLAALGSLGGVWSAFQGQGLLAFLLLRRAYSSLPFPAAAAGLLDLLCFRRVFRGLKIHRSGCIAAGLLVTHGGAGRPRVGVRCW